jgi:hypothetical protein
MGRDYADLGEGTLEGRMLPPCGGAVAEEF